jgi:hypothetical protein
MTLGVLALALSLRAAAAPAPVAASTAPAGADAVEALLQQGGAPLEGEFKVTVPQSDLGVTVDGFPIVPAMGLTSWIAFAPHGGSAMAMGDLVLLEDEVAPVQRAALAAGFSVTGIHNHFLRDKPKVMFMHVGAHGTLDTLTDGARRLFTAVSAARKGKGHESGPTTAPGSLDARALQKIVGGRPISADGVVKFVVPRPDVALTDGGHPVSAGMGFNSWMAFEGTMEKAAVSGDVAMLSGEVDSVVRAVAGGGLEVTALHNHMIGETPAVYFLHFWGVGRAEDLARAVKGALQHAGP